MDQKLREHIELFISCKDLRDLDTFTLSDPFVIMFVKDGEKCIFLFLNIPCRARIWKNRKNR